MGVYDALPGCRGHRSHGGNKCETRGGAHRKTARRILQYIRRVKDLGPTCGGKKADGVKVSTEVDAGHTTCVESKWSVSRRGVLLRGTVIETFSRAQEVTGVATSDSEFIVVTGILKGVVKRFITRGLEDYAIPIKTGIQGAVKMDDNLCSSSEGRGTCTSCTNFIRDAVQDKRSASPLWGRNNSVPTCLSRLWTGPCLRGYSVLL